MKDHKLSPAMRKALVHEWWALPKFTVIGTAHRLTYAALERRGLVKNGHLTPEGKEVAEFEWVKWNAERRING